MAKIASIYGSFEEFQGVVRTLNETISIDESVYYPRYEIAKATSDESISFGPLTTASVLVISSDYEITYKLNSSSDSITLNAGGVHILMGSSITAISVSEADVQACVLEIYLGGT